MIFYYVKILEISVPFGFYVIHFDYFYYLIFEVRLNNSSVCDSDCTRNYTRNYLLIH